MDVKVDTQGCGLGEDVFALRFEVGVKQRGGSGTGPGCVAHAQLLKLPKSGFPMSLQKQAASFSGISMSAGVG